MKTEILRTRKLGGQHPIDIELEPVCTNVFGKAEVVVSISGAIEEQRAIVGLRPREAARLGRLLIKAAGVVS